ncbi:hypothetical protein QVD17_08560 [Tagetes erecta]|uniref:Reverse transcriptase n=1 Tax=Tagetes erecta TaxID=13708 RepID=A0AAD8KZ67_TARER|nr:hypothetical protein QVD17_08560 [Tagetes erecta]
MVAGTMGEVTPNPNASQGGVDPMNYASKLKEGVKINFRRLESETRVEEADVVLPREAVMNMKQRFANTLVVEEDKKSGKNSGFQVGKQKQKFEYRPVQKDNRKGNGTFQPSVTANRFEVLNLDPGPSGTTIGEGVTNVDELGADMFEMDRGRKEDISRMAGSEGASTPVKIVPWIRVDRDPNDCDLRDKERVCSLEYEKVAFDLELFLKQKAKVEWLKAGDSNTAYFHKMVKRNNHKKLVDRIIDSDGNVHEGDGVASVFENHYLKFLGTEFDRRIDDWMNKALSFAGRLQLIVSVVSSMFTYWASVLILPASTVKELERKMKGFLWQKDGKDRAKAKITKIILDTVRLKLVSLRETHVISNWKTRKRWDLERIVLHDGMR